MQILSDAGPRGRVVRSNATTLALALGQGDGQMHTALDVFADGDIVTVGEEDIRVDSHGSICQVTRGMNGTADAGHAAGQNVRLAAGATILEHGFDGAEYLSAVRAGGEVEAMFGLEVNGLLRYVAATTPYQLEAFFPLARYQPAEGDTLRVAVWSWAAEAVFWAAAQS